MKKWPNLQHSLLQKKNFPGVMLPNPPNSLICSVFLAVAAAGPSNANIWSRPCIDFNAKLSYHNENPFGLSKRAFVYEVPMCICTFMHMFPDFAHAPWFALSCERASSALPCWKPGELEFSNKNPRVAQLIVPRNQSIYQSI